MPLPDVLIVSLAESAAIRVDVTVQGSAGWSAEPRGVLVAAGRTPRIYVKYEAGQHVEGRQECVVTVRSSGAACGWCAAHTGLYAYVTRDHSYRRPPHNHNDK